METSTASSSHSSLGKPVRALINGVGTIVILTAVALLIVGWKQVHRAGTSSDEFQASLAVGGVVALILIILWSLLVSGVRVAAQWERGIMLRLGKFKGVRGPGIVFRGDEVTYSAND